MEQHVGCRLAGLRVGREVAQLGGASDHVGQGLVQRGLACGLLGSEPAEGIGELGVSGHGDFVR
ncbi:hypothetical protein [Streptomyces sp. NPDC059863]|uniref:hypothetical protein n=1 Tax=unclassified Streptomyces TaxID=2593676 RepID=UPI003659F6FE